MIKSKLNFAIIGCGNVAIDHANVIKKLGHKIILGSTESENSKNWKIFKKKFPLVKFSSINQIIREKKIDRILSCLPLEMNKKYINLILSSKTPVLIEKPIHDNFFKLNKILKGSKNFSSNKIIAYNRRSYKVIGILKDKIKKTNLKNVEVNISENINFLEKKYKKNLKKKFLHVGSSSHIIDIIYYLLGDLRIFKKWKIKSKSKISSFFILIDKNNTPISVNINSSDPMNASIIFRFFDETLYKLSPIEELGIYKFNKIVKSNSNFYKKKYHPVLIRKIIEKSNFRPGFLEQMKKFINKDFKGLCSIKDNIKLLKLFNQLNKK